jgi:O-antigen/teichoic acid export membrane protein
LRALSSVLNDALYRSSLILLANIVATSVIGFAFWTLAAHRYPASSLGVFSSVTSGASLLAAVAALGLPNTMTRHVSDRENSRELIVVAIAAIATVGTVLCIVTVLTLGPHLPTALHLQQRGSMVLIVTVLVVFTAISGTLDAGLVAIRSTKTVLVKNLVGSFIKIAGLFALVNLRSSGLLISYSVGLVLATLLGGISLIRSVAGNDRRMRPIHVLRRYLSITSGNYLATIMGIFPMSVVPIEVLLRSGATQTARFAAAFLIAGFLNFIPSTIAQVLFAEASRNGVSLGRQLRKAVRGVYGLLLPALGLVLIAAPLALRIFGSSYAAAATNCLRVLALSALLTGGTYLVDSLLIARDRIGAYIFINGANAVLVLGCVWILLPGGLTYAAIGWALAQAISLMLGLVLLATGKVGRHHPIAPAATQSRAGLSYTPSVINSFDPQIRELLEKWPTMPTTLIAEYIGWNRSIQVLLDRVSELRSSYTRPDARMNRSRFRPGEIVQCGFWFPPVDVPVGSGQVRSLCQLPVLTMITGYSRWLSALLVPSRCSEDVFLGWWELVQELGAVPQVAIWDNEPVIGRYHSGLTEITAGCRTFSRFLGTRVMVGRPADPRTRGLIERAHVYLERSFLPSRTFSSPADFNFQLHDWLEATNTGERLAPTRSPTELIDVDRSAMLPLPPAPPPVGWHMPLHMGGKPYVHFDSNDYLVPSVVGRGNVEIIADLSEIKVMCDGAVVASHQRSWTRNRIIGGGIGDAAARPSARQSSESS